MARPKATLTVTDEQRRVLGSMAHRARTAPSWHDARESC